MHLSRRVPEFCLILTAFVACVGAFQNCSPSSSPSVVYASGGSGVDGKTYYSYGECSAPIVQVKSGIVVSSDGKSAYIVRDNCEALAQPKSLDTASFKFVTNDSTIFTLNGRVYDQQLNTGTQRITLKFCQAAGIENLIWENIGNTSQIYGSVNRGDGTSTGVLSVLPPTDLATEYRSAPGQNSQFALTLSGIASGSLTYSIGGGSPLSVSDLSCASQSQPPITNDGSSAAPVGVPQRPALLTGYSVRPAWKVAGVDYAVGFAAGQALKDPLSDPELSTNPKIAIDSVNRIIRITGSNVTLDGYDFTLHGGYDIAHISGDNVTVKNSAVGFIVTNAGTTNLTVSNCVMDGGGATNGWALISHSGTGTLTVEYNWFRNFPAHVIEDNSGGNLVYRFNLIESGGMTSSLNYLQLGGGPYYSLLVEFNTSYQVAQPSSIGEGYQFFYGNGPISGEIAYNTMITVPIGGKSAMTYMIHVGGGTQFPAQVTASIHDNYMDPSGSAGAFYGGVNNDGMTSATYQNNVNMATGLLLPTDP